MHRGSLFVHARKGCIEYFIFVHMILENFDLQAFNTFGIQVNAKRFARFRNLPELQEVLLQRMDDELLILGGGSNVLFTRDFDGLVLLNEIAGIRIVAEDENHICIQAGAGEVWHNLVVHCVERGWGGIENLSLIPGSVGASPMQNIGAYGVEIKDVFEELEAYHIESGEVRTFRAEDCAFGYRESVFKHELKGQYIILNVTYRLSKHAQINTRYGVIEAQLAEMQIEHPTIKDVSAAVIAIRQSKLPNPAEIGNAGSFFKNPVVDREVFTAILANYPDAPSYPAPNDRVKLAAGWLIEKGGWKGWREKEFGVHAKQALVLVNYGGSVGNDIFQLSTQIIEDIRSKFGVELEREVNIL